MAILPMFPEEQKAKENKNCGYTKSNPRPWTKSEVEWVMDLKSKGYSVSQLDCYAGGAFGMIKLQRLSRTI